MPAPQPAPEARPLCAFHADIVAVFTCTRCGSYACPRCRSAPDADLCERCASLVAVPARGDVSTGALLRDTFRLFFRNLQAVGVIALVYAGLSLAGLAARASETATGPLAFLNLVLNLATLAGFIRWVADGLQHGEERRLGAAVEAALRRFFFLGVMWVFYFLLVTLGMYLLILPGAYLALSMALAPAAVVLDGYGPYEALRRSYDMMKGYRLRMLGLFSVVFGLGFGLVFGVVMLGPVPHVFRGPGTGEALKTLVLSGVLAVYIGLVQCASVVAYVRIRGTEHSSAKPTRR